MEELGVIQAVTTDCAGLPRTELAYTLCELLDWRRPTGRLKNHEGRLLLEHLAANGLVALPPLWGTMARRGPRAAPRSPQGAPAPAVVGSLRDVLPLALEVVPPGRHGLSRLWRELIGRYHYLGDRVPVGATLRYVVRSARRPDETLACLGWTSAAWRIAVRDHWIGWTDAQRRQALPYIVNNSRFLILPWVHVKGLASHLLAVCARQLPRDWARRYGVWPLLLETLVDPSRFRGTCYRAANWLLLGETVGRGRMDRANVLMGHAPKLVYVYPLGRDVPHQLCTAPAPVVVVAPLEL
ncbi:MAG TPA: Druantia anti-phage system protein DruA [Anaeromyxobacteraceae bacterium]